MISCFIVSDASTVEVISGYAKRMSLSLKGAGTSLVDSLSEILLIKPDIVYVDISSHQHHHEAFNMIKQVCSLVFLSDKTEDAYGAFEYYQIGKSYFK